MLSCWESMVIWKETDCTPCCWSHSFLIRSLTCAGAVLRAAGAAEPDPRHSGLLFARAAGPRVSKAVARLGSDPA